MVFTGNPVPEIDADWIQSGRNSLMEGTHLIYFWSSGCPDCVERAKKLEQIDRRKLNVIGIHSPEHEFERDENHLKKVLQREGITHPIAHDRDRKSWQSFQNFNGPKMLIVEDGLIRVQTSANSGDKAFRKELEKKGFSIEPFEEHGTHHALGINSSIHGSKTGKGRTRKYSPTVHRRKNRVHLRGKWRQEEEFLQSFSGSKLYFHGCRELHLTAQPLGIRDVEVKIGGEPVPEEKAGKDLRVEEERSYIRLKNPGVYELVKDAKDEIEISPERKTRLYRITTK